MSAEDAKDPVWPGPELGPELHDELRALARAILRGDRRLLDATELAHQAWLRLTDRMERVGRDEFIALCATTMRRLVVDEARRAEVRGSWDVPSDEPAADGSSAVDLIALDEALETLGATEPRWARVVELRFFGHLGNEEIAKVLGLSRSSVDRAWTLARAWLRRELAH